MIVDSSALVAIIEEEPEALDFSAALAEADRRRVSAATYVETAMVLDGRGSPSVSRRLDVLLETADIAIAPFTERQARLARAAFRDYGRRSGHPARLNLGDCFSYALAVDSGEPLLYQGDDFTHTDVRRALP